MLRKENKKNIFWPCLLHSCDQSNLFCFRSMHKHTVHGFHVICFYFQFGRTYKAYFVCCRALCLSIYHISVPWSTDTRTHISTGLKGDFKLLVKLINIVFEKMKSCTSQLTLDWRPILEVQQSFGFNFIFQIFQVWSIACEFSEHDVLYERMACFPEQLWISLEI